MAEVYIYKYFEIRVNILFIQSFETLLAVVFVILMFILTFVYHLKRIQ